MKRRKKLWIACAALAAVVALCALALVSRQAPFEFLRGGRVESVEIFSDTSKTPPETLFVTTYRFDISIGDLDQRMREELTLEKGWVWPPGMISFSTPGIAPRVENDGENRHVSFDVAWESMTGPIWDVNAMRVWVSRPATPLDRIAVWLHNR